MYTLIPKQSATIPYGQTSQGLFRRWEKLRQRHEEATSILDLPTLATQVQREIHMPDLAPPISVFASGEIQIEEVEKLEVSTIFEHVAVLEPHKHAAQEIPQDIISAMKYDGKRSLMYVLLWYNGKHYWPLYDMKRQRLMPSSMDVSVILDHIACKEDTPTAMVEPDIVERWSDVCIRAWCRRQNIVPDHVIRVCAMYLKPQAEQDIFQQWTDS